MHLMKSMHKKNWMMNMHTMNYPNLSSNQKSKRRMNIHNWMRSIHMRSTRKTMQRRSTHRLKLTPRNNHKHRSNQRYCIPEEH